MVITTHDSRLLDDKLIRHDEIWFTEMNYTNMDRCTQLFSLESYEDREEKHIDLAYLEGRYGAVPELIDFSSTGGDYDAN